MRRIASVLKGLNPLAPAPKKQVSVVKSLPAPIGGWNARDPLAAMKPVDAVKLDNWWPRVADCVIRGGAEDHVTGFASQPRTLATFAGLTAGSNKMFAADDAGIYDVTTAGVLGASVLARTNGYHVWTQMSVSGGTYLVMTNGVDKPAFFDGTTWVAVDNATTPALTGVTTSDLVSCNVYKRRLFFLAKGRLSFHYLPIDSIGGALEEFFLGPLCTKGGYTMAMATWTLDGGSGPDDYAVFVTSEGEAIVFTGTDPGDDQAWALVGVYFVGKPLGRKCFKKYSGDLVLLTEYGAFPLSRAIQSASVDLRQAITNKIEGAFIEAARTYGENTGWCVELLPQQGALLVNVPTRGDGAGAEQYVMNTTTKAWARFTGWNALDMLTFNKELYFCDQDKIAKAWTGHADFGENIIAEGQTAFNNFGSPVNKDFKLFRPMLRVNGTLTYSQGIAVDFDAYPGLTTATYTVVSAAVWDAAMWDQAFWGAGLEVVKDWNTPEAKIGEYGAGLLKVATNSLEVQWAANEYLYEHAAVVT